MVEYRLVGGSVSPPHAWPWTVQILWNSGRHCCGGALIEADIAVSAAHCFRRNLDPSSYRLLLGGFRFGSGEEYKVVNISVHPKFNLFRSLYDIALMRFEPPALFSEIIRKVCLPKVPASVRQKCIVTGWGHEREMGNCSTVLKEIAVPIFPYRLCNDSSHYNGQIHRESMLCAGYEEGGIDACQGDSGGPLFCFVDGAWVLYGLVSWGKGCAQPRKVGVYTKVLSFVSWIAEETSRLHNQSLSV
ncbi:unnamed protein product [Enterobius vermicularis]|uniref:Peptidase S1 domain-containing protein n=1 Tax=Enterobius vermicularis TaxID=51028 RepID=A0A0N4V2E7_ENTVE|nr:unnamed protein product [Enterobius vermicularis]